VAAVVVIVAVMVFGKGTAHALDLKVYRQGARAVVGLARHRQSLYSFRTRDGLPFTYPPFAALLMVPLAYVRFAVAVPIVRALLAFAVAGLWQTSLRAAGYRVGWLVLTLLTAASLVLEPIYHDIQLGQMSLIIVLLVVADLTGAVPPRYRGVLTGVAAGIKLTPLIFIPLFVLTRQWRALVLTLGSFAATVLIALAALPGESWHYWTRYVRESSRVGSPWDLSDQSIRGVLDRVGAGQHSTAAELLLAFAQVIVVGSALVISALWWRRGERLLAVSLTGVAGLLASPISWPHHWCWVVPLLVALTRLSYLAAGLATVPYLITLRLGVHFHWRDQVHHWDAVQNLIGNGYVWAALIVLTYAGWRLLREPRHPWRQHTPVPI